MKVPNIICAASIIVPRYTKIGLHLIISPVSIYAATIGFKIIYLHDCIKTYFLAVYVFKGEHLHILIFSFK